MYFLVTIPIFLAIAAGEKVTPLEVFPHALVLNQDDSFESDKIIGGFPATEGQFPHQVALIIAQSEGFSFCGGSLLSNTHVLTAAHCASGTSPENFTIRAGSIDRSSGGVIVGVVKNTVHPFWNSLGIDNDLAVLKLATPIDTSLYPGKIGFVELATYGTVLEEGTNCTVSGWGKTDSKNNTIPRNLRYVTIPIINHLECQMQNAAQGWYVSDAEICAGFKEGGKGSCNGDSGGALVLEGTNIQVGIVSYGSGTCVDPNTPTMYTNVAKFKSWIIQQTWD